MTDKQKLDQALHYLDIIVKVYLSNISYQQKLMLLYRTSILDLYSSEIDMIEKTITDAFILSKEYKDGEKSLEIYDNAIAEAVKLRSEIQRLSSIKYQMELDIKATNSKNLTS
jgi:predicted alternative tryptophan synthase beta-subunit